jgi:two-component system, NtrC family, sensor kinase
MKTNRANPPGDGDGDFPYFRRLWNTIVAALIGAALIPLLLIGGGMLYFAASTFRESALQPLELDAHRQRDAVDRFLAERIGDLRQIAAAMDPQTLTRPGAIESALSSLHASARLFTDLGVYDHQGRRLAHAGPYLPGPEDESGTAWFQGALSNGVHVSDVFSNYRNVPHCIIAVRPPGFKPALILRATFDAAFLENLVDPTTPKGPAISFLVNGEGTFQASPDGSVKWMRPLDFPLPLGFQGVRVSEHDGLIQAMAWLETTPWLSVVQVERKAIFEPIGRMRQVGIFVFILGAMLIVFTALLTTNHLVNRLEAKRKRIQLMDHHLRQANRMNLSLMLYKGFFEEINEALANIGSAADWIGESARRPLEPEEDRRDLDESLEQIKHEIHRSRDALDQLERLSRPVVPVIAEVNANKALDALTVRFQREAYFRNIRIRKDFQEPMPAIRSDPAQLEQVIQNLIFNALDAVGKDGEIRLETRVQGDFLHVTVADTGPGIAPEAIEKVFDPPYTTRPGHLGLGLAICREIMQKVGGDIRVTSHPGQGAAFTASFPVRFRT